MRDDNENLTPLTGAGSPEADINDAELRMIVQNALANVEPGTRVLAIIPDKTRDDNTHVLFPAAMEILTRKNVGQFDALVAQGTHAAMTRAEKLAKIGMAADFAGGVFDHKWGDADELVTIGELSQESVRQITGGL